VRELNGQDISEGEFANEKHVAHLVLTEDGRQILIATDMYHIFYLLATYMFIPSFGCLFFVHIGIVGIGPVHGRI